MKIVTIILVVCLVACCKSTDGQGQIDPEYRGMIFDSLQEKEKQTNDKKTGK